MMPSPTASTNQSALLSPPAELHLEVTSHLGGLGQRALSLANSYLHAIVASPPKAISAADLVRLETWQFALENELLACTVCLKLRPSSKFTPTMKTKKKRAGAGDAIKRFCNECGSRPYPVLDNRVFHIGSIWEDEGRTFIRRWQCKRAGQQSLSGHTEYNGALPYQQVGASTCITCADVHVDGWEAENARHTLEPLEEDQNFIDESNQNQKEHEEEANEMEKQFKRLGTMEESNKADVEWSKRMLAKIMGTRFIDFSSPESQQYGYPNCE